MTRQLWKPWHPMQRSCCHGPPNPCPFHGSSVTAAVCPVCHLDWEGRPGYAHLPSWAPTLRQQFFLVVWWCFSVSTNRQPLSSRCSVGVCSIKSKIPQLCHQPWVHFLLIGPKHERATVLPFEKQRNDKEVKTVFGASAKLKKITVRWFFGISMISI